MALERPPRQASLMLLESCWGKQPAHAVESLAGMMWPRSQCSAPPWNDDGMLEDCFRSLELKDSERRVSGAFPGAGTLAVEAM